ncbi:MAG TPA: hypothetical protein VFH39_05255 [Candidatus Saccharimonadales bacterium]|nr:hypothetical protein [Candidatus Saccharimonadales bacterium]
MFQLSRQILRITVLTIGFILFVVVTVHSATQATNREAVVGKPSLFTISQLGASSTLAAANLSGPNSMAPDAVNVPQPAGTHVATTQTGEMTQTMASPAATPPAPAKEHAAASLPQAGQLPPTAAPQAVAATAKAAAQHQLP